MSPRNIDGSWLPLLLGVVTITALVSLIVALSRSSTQDSGPSEPSTSPRPTATATP